MLLLGHVGYSIGATWAWNSRKPVTQTLDYRLAGLAAIGPDIVDRIIFVFLLSNATQGRLFAHTLFSGLIVTILLFLIKNRLWKYGFLYSVHLILDCANPPTRWASLLFWPLFGVNLKNVGVVDNYHESLPERISLIGTRLNTVFTGYTEAAWWLILIELTGGVILLRFIYSKRLFGKKRLKRFIIHGKVYDKVNE